MGNASRYRPQPKTYRLRFDTDHDLAGLVVRARSVKLGAFLDVAGLIGIDPQQLTPEDGEKLAQLFSAFAGALVDWNLEDQDGEPVPATLEGLHSQDVDLVLPVIKAWFEAIGGVAGPLGPSSSASGPSVAPPIPMEPLSQSRAS